ncbi:transcription-repair coupling factor [Actinoalloteichus hymeniacidonis]|uniref:Transcription-repair-coupling factor n=1 Tax=Actinoalloteichus hymeniacidonis TaxID=340345 RepID=A0AAC9MX67_9PSEU|nr:transcription-repair coupling factor [Actinoalloteichus hymeniacidonis]AOS61577.1 transcription-repair coupling factor [Actinoalloteichus hymeniacidonis]MBB5910413.1 transcription-repair coupling factor (superfamily II helicase) [Actinoalloteichus hymeniacidonis]
MSAPLAGLLTALLGSKPFQDLVDAAGSAAVELGGPPALRPLVAAVLAAQQGADRPVLLVTATGREAEESTAVLGDLIGPDAVAELPSWETLPHERLSPRADTVGRRLAVLRRLAHPKESGLGPLRVVVTTVRSLIQPLAPGLGEVAPVHLRVGEEHDFAEQAQRLANLAYSRVDMVEKRGEFAVRGGILDVFPPTCEHPLRVEFWGDEVSEIRAFSVADQRSLPEPVAELLAPPCRELLITDSVRSKAEKLAEVHQADAQLAEMLAKIAEGIPVEGMEALIPALCEGELALLPDLLPRSAHVLLADPEKIRGRAADLVRTGQEFLEASWMTAAGGGGAPIDLGASAYRSIEEVEDHTTAGGRPWWTLTQLLSEPDADATSDADALQLDVRPVEAYRGEVERAFVDLRAHTAAGGAAIVVFPGAGTASRAADQLRDAEVPVRLITDGLTEAPATGVVSVVRATMEDGFIAADPALVVLTEADLTGGRGGTSTRDMRRMPSRRRNAVDPLGLTPGDYVVHDKHGIGRYVEMSQRTVAGATREYLVLEYASSKRGQPGDRLFVPTDQLDEVSRYVGGELPTLNRLGGSDWAKTKTRAKKAVREIAAELVQLYAARQSAPGHAFGPDTPWQRELEDAFPYNETIDQLAAIDEVKGDMRRAVPMDRVICGDVGYGKTEIAVRAAFKAVQDGKQVVVLVPTTLLAQQHLNTFSERMRSFPVVVKGMSRFTDKLEADEVINGLAAGDVDVVIGTHRLLQTGIRYKDLGLVIVDEEQRFGVEHKEHIKALRTHVDVLTMSATPIPRTLEMSLAGIREMSTILTPPEERHPVLTYVGQYDGKQTAAAIRRELLRDGQVFYVHNRVSSIEKAAKQLRELVPEAKVVTAHGQMNEDRLEKIIQGFWEREFDVLVCTTIIETGLDISNANTLIVERGDMLGLAQLHQLRGRVGRARERGYAYFLYPAEKPLTETAHDRLATIAQNSELGSGMAVAMKDLEIRGAGNILGAEQSGHIAGVGFDLYIRLVGEAVAAFRKQSGASEDGDAVEESTEVRIDLPVTAHIPHDYVPGERLRLEAYRKIASASGDSPLDSRERVASDADALAAVRAELVDRYGPPPIEVDRLLAVSAFRQLCRRFGIAEVTLQGNLIRFAPMELRDSQLIRLERLYPKATYKPALRLVSVPRPTEGGAGGRLGAPPLRDEALLSWAEGFLSAMAGVPAPAAASAGNRS